MIVYFVIWYLIGFLSSLYFNYIIGGYLTRRDILMSFTLGGIGGMTTFIVGLYVSLSKHNDYWDKKIF